MQVRWPIVRADLARICLTLALYRTGVRAQPSVDKHEPSYPDAQMHWRGGPGRSCDPERTSEPKLKSGSLAASADDAAAKSRKTRKLWMRAMSLQRLLMPCSSPWQRWACRG